MLVESITPVVLLALFFRFKGDAILLTKYSIMFLFLIPVFFIDLYHRLILDKLTIPMAVLGLLFTLMNDSDVRFLEAVLTALGIIILLLFIAWIYEKVRQREGIGGGDIKLLAALSIYIGVLSISFVIFISSLLAVIIALITAKTQKHEIPFGPFLAITSLFWVFLGNNFLNWYINLF